MTAATASGMAPRWTGMWAAWATIEPWASNSAADESRRSLMLGEYAPRTRAAPISSATPANPLARTDRVTGSSLARVMAPLPAVAPHDPAPAAPATTVSFGPASFVGRSPVPLQHQRARPPRLGDPARRDHHGGVVEGDHGRTVDVALQPDADPDVHRRVAPAVAERHQPGAGRRW